MLPRLASRLAGAVRVRAPRCVGSAAVWAPRASVRFQTTDSTKAELLSSKPPPEGVPIGKLDQPPKLMIAFTCKKCSTRSSHTMSKQAYETGLVLIQCPGCKNRHLIADNLKVFSEGNFNLRKYLEEHGELISDDPSKMPASATIPEPKAAVEDGAQQS